jgi:Protein of unknown function (DUF1759)
MADERNESTSRRHTRQTGPAMDPKLCQSDAIEIEDKYLRPKVDCSPLCVDQRGESYATSYDERAEEVHDALQAKVAPLMTKAESELFAKFNDSKIINFGQMRKLLANIAKNMKKKSADDRQVQSLLKQLHSYAKTFFGMRDIAAEAMFRNIEMDDVGELEKEIYQLQSIAELIELTKTRAFPQLWDEMKSAILELLDTTRNPIRTRSDYVQEFRPFGRIQEDEDINETQGGDISPDRSSRSRVRSPRTRRDSSSSDSSRAGSVLFEKIRRKEIPEFNIPPPVQRANMTGFGGNRFKPRSQNPRDEAGPSKRFPQNTENMGDDYVYEGRNRYGTENTGTRRLSDERESWDDQNSDQIPKGNPRFHSTMHTQPRASPHVHFRNGTGRDERSSLGSPINPENPRTSNITQQLTRQQMDELFAAFESRQKDKMRATSILNNTTMYPENFEDQTCTDEIYKNNVPNLIRGSQLPTFSGSPKGLLWKVWWNKFHDVINKYAPSRLSDSKKFEALISVTSGDARDLISAWYHAGATDQYREAVAELHRQYGNTEKQRMALAKALREAKPESNTLSGYKKFFNLVRTYKLQLQAAGEREEAAAEIAFEQLKAYAPSQASLLFHAELERETILADGSRSEFSAEQKFMKLMSFLGNTIHFHCVDRLAELDIGPVPSNKILTKEEQREQNDYEDNAVFLGNQAATYAAPVHQPHPQQKNQNSGQKNQSSGQKKHDNHQSHNHGQKRSQDQNYEQNNRYTGKKAQGQHNYQTNKKFPGQYNRNSSFRRVFRAPQWLCPFCEENDHSYVLCPKTHDERERSLVDKQKCLNCARPGHTHMFCKSWSCRNCRHYGMRSYHHTGLCKFEEHPKTIEFKEQKRKEAASLPKVKPQFAQNLKQQQKEYAAKALGVESKKRKTNKNLEALAAAGLEMGTSAYIASAYATYPVRETDSDSEEDPISEDEAEVLEPENEADD